MVTTKMNLRCVLIIALSSCLFHGETRAAEIALGYLRGSNIWPIMYYRNGTWVQQVHYSFNNYLGSETFRIIDSNAYAKAIWETDGSVFSNWYKVNSRHNAPHRHKNVVTNEGFVGDCSSGGGDSIEVHVVESPVSEAGPGWAATTTSGFNLNDFTELFTTSDRSGIFSEGQRVAALPPFFGQLADQIKTRWASLEGTTVQGLIVEPGNESDIKDLIKKTPYARLHAYRARFSDGLTTLYFFKADKFIHSPKLGGPTHEAHIRYRGWALQQSDRNLSWPAIIVGLGSSYSVRGNYAPYREIEPLALLELDNRSFLIAKASVDHGSAGTLETELFELVSGKFKSIKTYASWCD